MSLCAALGPVVPCQAQRTYHSFRYPTKVGRQSHSVGAVVYKQPGLNPHDLNVPIEPRHDEFSYRER